MRDLFGLPDEQKARLRPYFPKSHGRPRVYDRRVLSGIIFINLNGLRWRDAPRKYSRRRRSVIVGSGGAIWASSRGSWRGWPLKRAPPRR